MNYREIPLCFDCGGASLLGVLTAPARDARVGVVIVVGGPQYRVGSHRQFVLLSRDLAAAGYACLRFDYRGMGDSAGPRITFEQAGPDIGAAIDVLCREIPSIDKVVLWGLCDGAAAGALFAHLDPRVAGLALFNPWVRTEAGEAEAALRHYYAKRVSSRAFWRKVVTGKLHVTGSAASMWSSIRRAVGGRHAGPVAEGDAPLPERVGTALLRFRSPVLVALSGNDSVAAEFRIVSAKPGPLADAMRLTSGVHVALATADHTFSSARWRAEAAAATLRWLGTQFADARQVVNSEEASGERTSPCSSS